MPLLPSQKVEMFDSIAVEIFEIIGTILGLVACVLIFIQVLAEFKSKKRSTLSKVYVYGWIFIYAFWWAYGVRFGSVALIVSNTIAVILQSILALRVTAKSMKNSD